MTRQRNDNHSTEFGIWLREQKEIDSNFGYIATNIDYMWMYYKNDEWMLIEEKRYGIGVKKWQRKMFDKINRACKIGDKKYKGFHLIVFEKTNPEDGKIWLDKKEIKKNELIEFLKMGENYKL